MKTSTSRVSQAPSTSTTTGIPILGTYDIYEYDDKGAFSVTDQVEKESGE